MPTHYYHGTSAAVRSLSPIVTGTATGNPTSVWGTFFTPDKSEATRYIEDFHNGEGNLIIAELNLMNPYHMPFQEYNNFTKLDLGKGNLNSQMKHLTEKARNFKKDVISKGHDGIIIGEPGKLRPQEIVVFSENQIETKSIESVKTSRRLHKSSKTRHSRNSPSGFGGLR